MGQHFVFNNKFKFNLKEPNQELVPQTVRLLHPLHRPPQPYRPQILPRIFAPGSVRQLDADRNQSRRNHRLSGSRRQELYAAQMYFENQMRSEMVKVSAAGKGRILM